MFHSILHHAASPRSILLMGFCAMVAFSQDGSVLKLPAPQLAGGRPLMQVLRQRMSSRAFSGKTLSPQDLSNLLWAAFGVNRPETGGRTAPSAMDMQEIDVYAATADGIFLYDAKKNELEKIAAGDLRKLTGMQPFVKDAPLNIVLVADYSRAKKAADASKRIYAAADAGFISQNIYLYCASEGLATVVRASIDKLSLAKAMNLASDQEIIFAQTVGYPGK